MSRAAGLCVLLAAATARAFGGPGDVQALPCRPTIACTAELVPPGTFEIETGYIVRRFANGAVQQSTPTLLKLTLARWIQLQLGSNGAIVASRPVPAAYVDDVVVEAKFHLWDQAPREPSLSFSAALSVPTAGQPSDLRSYDVQLTAYVTKDIGPVHADLNFGANLWRVEGPVAAQGWVALALSAELPRHFGIMTEGYTFTDAAPLAPRDSGLLVAGSFTPRRWLVIDLGGDVGLGGARQVSGFAGLTVVPLRLWHSATAARE